jgi:hypothetical protein
MHVATGSSNYGGTRHGDELRIGGAGVASAAAPTLKIKPFATWTLELKAGGCELDSFNTFVNTFVPDESPPASGNWSGGGSTIKMVWTAGDNTGLSFSGHFVSTTTPVEYQGTASEDGNSVKAKLVKEVVATYHGLSC